MASLIDLLEERRTIADRKATEHRTQRDEWNGRTKEHLEVRNDLNGQVRELIDEAQAQREIREQENQRVRETKAVREEFNEQVREAKTTLEELKGEGPDSRNKGASLHHMKREFARLEAEFETGRYTGKKEEKKVFNQLRELQRAIKQQEKEEAENTGLRDARETLRAAMQEQENAHQAVTLAAEQAQAAHELMVELHREVDKLRAQADAAQRRVRHTKKEADTAHRYYITSIRCLHSIQDMLRVLRNRGQHEASADARHAAREEAQDLMAKLMAGETLDMDELMALQRQDG